MLCRIKLHPTLRLLPCLQKTPMWNNSAEEVLLDDIDVILSKRHPRDCQRKSCLTLLSHALKFGLSTRLRTNLSWWPLWFLAQCGYLNGFRQSTNIPRSILEQGFEAAMDDNILSMVMDAQRLSAKRVDLNVGNKDILLQLLRRWRWHGAIAADLFEVVV